MNWKNTWLLVGTAAVLFAFIFLYERHLKTSDAVTAPAPLLGEFKATSATTLQVRRGNAFVVSLGRTNGEWRYTSPFSYPAATLAVNGLLEMLDGVIPATHITPQEMVARKQTSADFGFDAPTIVITLQQGNEPPQHVRFGTRTPANDQVYVDVGGRPGIYVVSAAVLDRLPRAQNAWRDPALVMIPESKVDRLEISAGAAGGFEMRRDPTNKVWRLTRPPHRADQLKAAYLVKELADAQIASFVLDEPPIADLEPFGLHAPAAEVTLAAGTEVQKIQFGRSPTNDPTQVYARQVGASNVVLVPRRVLELATTNSYTEYRNRLLIGFAPQNVQAVEIKSAQPFTMARQPNGAWTVGDNPVDSAFINDWLNEFSRVDIREFVKDVVTDLTPFGLEMPKLSIVLRIATPGGVQASRIDFGKNDTPQTVLVRRADEDSIYSISGLALVRTPAESWQLRDHRVWSFTTNQVTRVVVREGGRTRQFLRQPTGQWAVTSGEVNPFAMEEMMFALGTLRANAWVARGEQALAQHGFAEKNYEIAIDLKDGDKTQTVTVKFAETPLRLPFAATTIDGQPWVFEFPWPLFTELQRYLSVPSAGAGL